jgi:AraC-like DNA-binding protein
MRGFFEMNYNLNNTPFIKYKFKKQSFKKHFHTTYSIGLITKGTYDLYIENKKIVTTEGKIKVINPYELHVANGDLSWEYLNFMPSIDTVNSLAIEMCDNFLKCNITFNNQIDDMRAINHFNELYKSSDEFEYEERYIILLSYLLKNHANNRLKQKDIPKNIKDAIDFIHTYFNEEISLDMLSKVSNISKYHLVKTFSKKVGLTPHQYIINLRLNYAISLIKKREPLAVIAYQCGFSDQSHFIKTFKKHYGFTPSLIEFNYKSKYFPI